MKKLIDYLLKKVSANKADKILEETILLAIVISLVHFFTYNSGEIYLKLLHELLTKLYFLPVLIAALFLGRKGAIQLSLVVSILYLPHSINTNVFSGFLIVENLSEIILIWAVGLIAGILIDKVKNAQAEKARLAALEKVSSVINVINNDIMNDYSACVGLTRSLKSIYNNSDGNSFTASLLSEKLERLGSHISHLSNLAAPKPVKRIRYNLFHLTKKCVNEIIQNNSGYNVSFMNGTKQPPVYMDVSQIEFAVKQISQSFLKQNTGKKELVVSESKYNEMIKISLEVNGEHNSIKKNKMDVFDLVADPESGYSFALASSIIRSHGGRVEFETGKEGIKSIDLFMPVNNIDYYDTDDREYFMDNLTIEKE
ncbi:MAG: hypothetical protein WC879_07875 [Melioribacteraceae bacterium]